jgi:hypothetical protein
LICGTKSFNKDMINYVKQVGILDERIHLFWTSVIIPYSLLNFYTCLRSKQFQKIVLRLLKHSLTA